MTEMEKIVVAAALGHLSKNGFRLTTDCQRFPEDDIKITRKSDREYDLKLEGPGGIHRAARRGDGFSAWLPLLCIREMTCWTKPDIANLTDYPSMAEQGDWSGVRDTDPEKIMEIFKKFVVKPMEHLFKKGA